MLVHYIYQDTTLVTNMLCTQVYTDPRLIRTDTHWRRIGRGRVKAKKHLVVPLVKNEM
jgi:hypothetical protein